MLHFACAMNMCEWVGDWVGEWVSEWLSEWVSECVIGWVNGWAIEWVTEWAIDLSCGWLSGWVIEWLIEWVTGWVSGWVIEWMSEWLSEWVRDWLIEWVIEWGSDWFCEWESECGSVWVSNLDTRCGCVVLLGIWPFIQRKRACSPSDRTPGAHQGVSEHRGGEKYFLPLPETQISLPYPTEPGPYAVRFRPSIKASHNFPGKSYMSSPPHMSFLCRNLPTPSPSFVSLYDRLHS